jgi:hypothetical protein
MYGGYAKRNCSSTGKSEGRDVLPKRLQAKNGAGTGKTRINAILTPPDTRRDTSLLHNMSLTGAFILQVRLHTINRSKRIRPMQADRLQAVHITCLNSFTTGGLQPAQITYLSRFTADRLQPKLQTG